MKSRRLGFWACTVGILLSGFLSATVRAAVPAEDAYLAADDSSGEADLYRKGRRALDDERYREAVRAFGEVADGGGRRADGALYWKAVAQSRMQETADALGSLRELRVRFPESSWVDDARVLEDELRSEGRGSRHPGDSADDEDLELKLMAIQSLMHSSDDERAVGLLTKLLRDDQPQKIRERALFVLAQSSSKEAVKMISDFARGTRDPGLQKKAIFYLGIHGGPGTGNLMAEIFRDTESVEVKKSILHSYMASGQRGLLLDVARDEKDPDVRKAAARWLGAMGAHAELWELYQRESSIEVRKGILHGFGISGGVRELSRVAGDRNEDMELRKAAVRGLGISGGVQQLAGLAGDNGLDTELRAAAINGLGISGGGTELLKELYASSRPVELRKKVLHAMFIQGSVPALIHVAETESDLELRKSAVHWLSVSGSREATDYLIKMLEED